MAAKQQHGGVEGKFGAGDAQGSEEHMKWKKQRSFVRRSEEGEMRSRVNPFNLEDEAVGPLDVRGTIMA
jgi:hypothetical protein